MRTARLAMPLEPQSLAQTLVRKLARKSGRLPVALEPAQSPSDSMIMKHETCTGSQRT